MLGVRVEEEVFTAVLGERLTLFGEEDFTYVLWLGGRLTFIA